MDAAATALVEEFDPDVLVEVDGRRIVATTCLSKVLDPDHDTWHDVDPFPLRVELDHEGGDTWRVTIRTPVLTALGRPGPYAARFNGTLELNYQLDGSTMHLVLRDTARFPPHAAPEIFDTAADLLLFHRHHLTADGTRFACQAELDDEPPPTTPGVRQLHAYELAVAAYDFTTAATLAAEASPLFAAAGFDELHIRADACVALARTFTGGLGEAQELLRCCEERAAGLRFPSRQLEGMLALVSSRTKSGFLTDHGGAATDLDRARELGALDDPVFSDTERIHRLTDPGTMSDEAAAIVVEHDADADDTAAAIDRLVVLSGQAGLLGDFARAVDLAEQAIELADAHDPTQLYILHLQLATLTLGLGQRRRCLDLLDALDDLEQPPQAAVAGGMALPLLRTLAGGQATDGLERLITADFGPLSQLAGLAREATGTARDDGTGASLLDQAQDLVDAIDSPIGTGLLRAGLGLQRFASSTGDREAAAQGLRDLIAGIKEHDRTRHRLSGTIDRSLYHRDILQFCEALLLIGSEYEQPRLVAELLERLRLLGTPDGSPDPDTGLFPVSEPPHTSVAGLSMLADEDDRVERLEDRITAQTGPDAWWWSAWQGAGYLVWATRSPDGRLEAGHVPLGPAPDGDPGTRSLTAPVAALLEQAAGLDSADGVDLRRMIDELRRELRLGRAPGSPEDDAPLAGALGADHERGADLARRLGRALIPPGLRAALLDTRPERPVRLLYDLGASLAWLPVGLLDLGGGSDPTLVIERAVPQLAAPNAPPRGGRPSRSGHGVLGIVDPSDNLPFIPDLAERAERLLTCPGIHLTRPATSTVASPDSVMVDLADGDRYELLLVAGHHLGAAGESPLGGGLQVGVGADRTVLPVTNLIEHADRLRPPPRAVLCACSTAASAADPIVERWGFPLALLLAGTGSLVATSWDLRSCAATVAFVQDLLDAAGTADLATALRTVQLDRLRRWRQAVAEDATDFDERRPDCHHPYLWAPFVAIGDCRPW